MAEITAKAKFRVQRHTAAEWAAADIVLLDGEIGYETDTYKAKVGDGASKWSALEYAFCRCTGSGGGDSSADDTAAEGLASLASRLSTLEEKFSNLISGELIIERLTAKALDLYGANTLLKSGEGAPVQIPDFVPQFYCDTTTGTYYRSKGATAVSDWVAM